MQESKDSRNFICNVCAKCFKKPSLLLRHASKHNETTKYYCSRCKKYFSQQFSLQKHLKDLVCDRRALKQGKMTVPSTSPPTKRGCNNIKKNVCIYCDRSFRKPSDLERHVLTHTNERLYKCERAGCVKSFKLKNTLERHLSTHERQTFTCTMCLCNYKSEKALLNHKRLHSRLQIFELVDNRISRCNSVVVVQANEKITDNKSISSSDLLNESSSPPYNDSPLTLEINHVEVGNEEIVESTEEIDERVVPQKTCRSSELVCKICSKCFKKPIDLKRHSDAVHEKKRPFACSIAQCDKSFSLKCTLNRHMETHRQDREVMTCEVCAKTLSSASNLKFHQRIHKELKPHQCSTCYLKFRTPGNIKSHLKTHMNSTKSNLMAS